MAEKTWLREITSEDAWAQDPQRTAARAVGCALTLPFCLAYELGTRAGELSREATTSVGEVIGGGAGSPGIIAQAGEAAERTFRGAAAPIEAASHAMMWLAIAIIAIAVLGVVFFAWRTFG